MITLDSVHKRFGKVTVLHSINLLIERGRVVSLLGPNGSGKSTLMKCILHLVHPTSGEIHIQDISASKTDARALVSYMPQVAKFAENITPMQLLNFIGDLRGKRENPWNLIQYFDLESQINKSIGELSGGTRQKVSALLAFLFDTPIIVLDEPTVGLDPVSRIKFKKLVLRKKAEGKTIFFTSHIMSDVEEVADEIIFLLEGRIVFNGTQNELKLQTGMHDLEHSIVQLLTPNPGT